MQMVWVMERGAEAHLAKDKAEVREVLGDPLRGAGHLFLDSLEPYEYEGLLLLAPREIDHWVEGRHPFSNQRWYGMFHWDTNMDKWVIA